jgi:hypothetical protein
MAEPSCTDPVLTVAHPGTHSANLLDKLPSEDRYMGRGKAGSSPSS